MTPAQQVSLLIPVAYVFGSVPFGLIVGKSKGIDPRTAGSGNIGATNVGRLLGKRFFLIVFLLDLLKSMLPMLAAGWVLRSVSLEPRTFTLWLAVGFAAILGHMFSVFLGFKGGKGVATSSGVVLGLYPFYTCPGVICLLLWFVTFKATRYVSLASILAALAFPVAYVLIGIAMGWPVFDRQWPLLAFAVLVAVMIVWKHRSNIARLRGDRTPIRPGRKASGASITYGWRMKQSLRPVWGIFGILCAVVAISLTLKALRPKEIVPWRADFDVASNEATASNKPVFAYFTADWCGPCQGMKSTTWADKDVEAALRDYVPVKIDVDRRPDLASQYGVRGVPTFIILGSNGHAIRQADGALPAPEMLAWLQPRN